MLTPSFVELPNVGRGSDLVGCASYAGPMLPSDQQASRSGGGGLSGAELTDDARSTDQAGLTPTESLRVRARVRLVSSTLLAASGVVGGLFYVLWPEFTGRPSPTAAAFAARLAGGLCLTVVACGLAALFAWSALARYARSRACQKDQVGEHDM